MENNDTEMDSTSQDTICKLWSFTKALEIEEVEDNTFIFSFENQIDRERAMELARSVEYYKIWIIFLF